ATFTYRPKATVHLPTLDAVAAIGDAGARIRSLFLGKDKVATFLHRTLGQTLLYSAEVAPVIAHCIDDIDRVMRWGFAWDLGPFEIWDAIGIREVLEAMGHGEPLATLVDVALRDGRNRFRDDGLQPASQSFQILQAAKDRQQIVRKNPGASLVDLGDGVLAL